MKIFKNNMTLEEKIDAIYEAIQSLTSNLLSPYIFEYPSLPAQVGIPESYFWIGDNVYSLIERTGTIRDNLFMKFCLSSDGQAVVRIAACETTESRNVFLSSKDKIIYNKMVDILNISPNELVSYSTSIKYIDQSSPIFARVKDLHTVPDN